MPAPARDFGFHTTTEQVLEGVDLSGRVAVVTGASSGLGEETARALASKGADVTIGCRDLQKGEAAAERIRALSTGAAIRIHELDLLARASIDDFTARFLGKHAALHILVNNAGVMACPPARTEQGWEVQLATNHLGHFMLTSRLAPALLAAAPSRVVVLSSAGHHRAGIDFDDPHFERRPYDKWLAYGQAKTANALFAVGLDRRLGDAGVHAFAVHPGAIPTELSRHLTTEDIGELLTRVETVAGGLKTVQSGAATSVWAATAPELEGRGGLYLEDCRVSSPAEAGTATTGYMQHAVDPRLADRLWELTESMLGERFPSA